MRLREMQKLMADIYLERDMKRGAYGTFIWLVEEIGELAETLRKNERRDTENEIADIIAWLLSLANVLGIDAEKAFVGKYGDGCPRCRKMKCECS